MNQLRIVVMEDGLGGLDDPGSTLLTEEHDATMRQLGLIDARTGLPHRDLLLDRLGQATAGVARGGSAFALMVIGTTPAAPGMTGLALEAVMQQFARQLHRLSRRTDSFARLNTSDFAALLPGNPSVAGLMSMGQKIAAEFADRVQVHIGVALCPRHANDADTLLAQARMALEQARQSQVITVLFEPRTAHANANANASAATPPATVAEPPRIAFHFQPVLDLHEGGLSHLQISVQGIDQTQEEFTPTGSGGLGGLARLGQIGRKELSAHLMATTDAALRCALPWRQQGLVQRLSLPLPGRLLDEPGLAAGLLSLLHRHRWPARQFMVEAHTAAIAQRGSDVIESLARAGVALAVNDGRSGLSLHVALAGLDPVAELKFDVAALDVLPHPEQRAAVVRALIALARGWNARVVANGVDDLATLAWLGDLGCDGAQGSACGKAMPAEQVRAWCAGHQGRTATRSSSINR